MILEKTKKNSKMNDIGHLFFRPYGDSDIKSSDKKIWGLTPPYPTLIVTNDNLCLNLEQIKTSTDFTTVAYFKPSLNSTLSNYYLQGPPSRTS